MQLKATIIASGNKLLRTSVSALDLTARSAALAVVTTSVGTIACSLELYRYVAASMAIGPYAAEQTYAVATSIQRIIVDITRTELNHPNWYPLDEFQQLVRRESENGHSEAGGVRDAARQLMTRAIQAMGYEKYEISPSRQSNAERAVVMHYAPGDLGLRLRVDPMTSRSILTCIDTDYYLNDPHYYLGFGQPFVIFTFSPTVVSGSDGDCVFTIKSEYDEQNVLERWSGIEPRHRSIVRYVVSGGNCWQHELWDWCAAGEFIVSPYTAHTGIGWFLMKLANCIGLEKVVYTKIMHARPWDSCPNRALVWGVPTHAHWKLKAQSCTVSARKLKRIDFRDKAKPGWNKIEVLRKTSRMAAEMFVSVGREGEDAQVSLPKNHYEILLGAQNPQSVQSKMLQFHYTDQAPMTSLFMQYYTGHRLPNFEAPQILAPVEAPKVHYPISVTDDFPTPSMRQYSHPIVTDSNLAPLKKRWDAFSNSVEERVTKWVNTKCAPPRYDKYYAEWLELIVPTGLAGTLSPLSVEDTIAQLTKPTQVAGVKQILDSLDMEPRKLVDAFIKNEPTMKNARIISGFKDFRYLVQFSRYTLAFREHVLHAEHNKHWFMPGRTPAEIAQVVVDFTRSVSEPAEGDFSNMDGTVSRERQKRVQGLYNRAFRPEFLPELIKLQSYGLSAPARAAGFGFRYCPGCGVKSGDMTTCDKNCCYNCESKYYACCIAFPHLTPKERFALVGPIFGDDDLFDWYMKNQINKVCKDLGYTFKAKRYDPEEGLTFLARVYPKPYDSTTSFQDPLRTFRKIHLTARDKTIPLGTAATDRLESYLVTDGLTPVISEYARKVISLYASEVSKDKRRGDRVSRHKEKSYWWTGTGENGASWPQDPNDIDDIYRVMSKRTGIPVEALVDWISNLEHIENVWEIPAFGRYEEPNAYDDHIDEDGNVLGGGRDIDLEAVVKRKIHDGRIIASVCKRNGSGMHTPECRCPEDEKSNATTSFGHSKPDRAPEKDAPSRTQRGELIARETEPQAGPSGHATARGNGKGNRGGHRGGSRRGGSGKKGLGRTSADEANSISGGEKEENHGGSQSRKKGYGGYRRGGKARGARGGARGGHVG